MGCPAIIQVRCIRVFTEYHIDESACPTANSLKMAKKKVLNQIKENRSNTTNSLSLVKRHYVKIPLCNIHKYHPLGAAATINHCVDKRVFEKIYQVVQKGVTRPDEVRRCVEEFVERDLFAHISPGERPKKTNRKYYPTREDFASTKSSEDNQESLRQKIIEWQAMSNANFFIKQRAEIAAKLMRLARISFFWCIKTCGSNNSFPGTDQIWS